MIIWLIAGRVHRADDSDGRRHLQDARDMRPKKKTNDGVLTYHIPFNIRLLASEGPEFKCPRPELRLSAPVTKTNSRWCIKQNKRDDAKEAARGYRLRRGTLSYTSTRLLQVKMEAEIQEAKELIRPLLDIEQDLETFLKTQDEGKMMKREVVRKWLHEDFWATLQKKLDHHMAVCNPAEIKMRQNLYQQFLNHGNAKGYVFLDICDLDAYNPYLHHSKKPHNCKLRLAELKEKESFYEKFKMRKTRCEAGCQYKWITPSRDQDGDYATPAIDLFTEQSPDNSTTDNTSLDIPFHVRESFALDGTCHHSGCWFSR
ncbi:protein FAM228A isoform X2 [Hippocampus zosterae]|uniref:protein FAM228A isoform X2 n=1 Tax=Hippocampus zosterae TaxID=109293 RepID=UPI00223E7992|nr:protein FAM228A isoform X2 [Hippocampus zosterae]